MNPIILIPARMGSTRLPGKPMADINGRPMILHVLARALAADVAPVAVACSELEVAEAVQAAGGRAVLTDPDLPSGSDRVHQALERLDAEGEFDVAINLQGDLPGIHPAQLKAVLEPLENPQFDVGTIVAPMVSLEDVASISAVKAVCGFADGARVAQGLYFSRSAVPWGEGPFWHHIGLYAWRREALARFVTLPESVLEKREKLEQLRALEAGMRIGCAITDMAPFEVNTPADLERARSEL